jgi:hypothetical protein
MENIEKKIIEEPPILTMEGGSTYGEWRRKNIYLSQLRDMSVGEEVCLDCSIIRDSRTECIKVLFKDDQGILLYHSIYFWDDEERNLIYDDTSPDETKDELIYIKLH